MTSNGFTHAEPQRRSIKKETLYVRIKPSGNGEMLKTSSSRGISAIFTCTSLALFRKSLITNETGEGNRTLVLLLKRIWPESDFNGSENGE
jgi:hypothetical protein